MSELFVSIPKQQQMMTQPMASIKFIKAKVIFSYHTKGVSNQVLSNSDHDVKFFFQIPVSKWEKTKKCNSVFWVTKRGNKVMTNLGRVYRLHIGAKRLQIRAKIVQIGTRGISNRSRDYKSVQNNVLLSLR